MHFGDYDDAGVVLALEVANSRPLGRWPEELPDTASLSELLERHGFETGAAPPAQDDLSRVHALRDRLVEVFEAPGTEQAAAALNAMLDDSGARPRLTDHDGTWHLHYEAADGRLATRIATSCAASLVPIVLEAGVSRFGSCGDDDCDSFFVDASKNVARRFCSQRCGTRTSVASYRARQREATSRGTEAR